MNTATRFITFSATVIALAGVLSGCGEKETNSPAIKLTASAVVSELAEGHGHSVELPFIDVSSAPTGNTYQYRSSDNTGHSHVIAISKQQMIDLNNGLKLSLTSSLPNAGTSHTHIWNIQGGNVLYEKNCYNCHSNDKRGHSPMNVSFSPSQTNAVINPAGQQISTSTAAIPNPAFTPSTTVSLDGAALYASSCAGCHNQLASSTKRNRSFTSIKTAISTVGEMTSLGALTDAQLQAIANVLTP
jgi:mono/diheme cytochrome c family protein